MKKVVIRSQFSHFGSVGCYVHIWLQVMVYDLNNVPLLAALCFDNLQQQTHALQVIRERIPLYVLLLDTLVEV